MEIKDIVNTVICGDCLEVMKRLPDELVNCVVTSPPYWGLRDYGVAGQFGLEKTPEEFIEKMVELFREARRVLRKDGVLWLNLGDSYSTSSNTGGTSSIQGSRKRIGAMSKSGHGIPPGLKPKDLCMIPARVALALQADGWYLRSEIVWHKPNPMPESVTDRPTKAHEMVYLLTKSPKYYYDAEAIKEDSVDDESYLGRRERSAPTMALHDIKNLKNAGSIQDDGKLRSGQTYPKRNKRSVWTIPTQAYPESHFATFPEKLVEPCILAGCPKEVCPKCGKARVRMVKKTFLQTGPKRDNITGQDNMEGWEGVPRGNTESETIGFTDCGCGVGFVPGVVLDPFGGAMTTALVAYKNSRDYVAIELNQKYIEMGTRRLNREKEKLSLFGKSPCIVPEPMIKQEENLF
jgi:DNA modification methylase